MRLFLICLLLAGCATELPTYQPENNDEYIEQLRAITDQQIKAETLKTYSWSGLVMLVSGVALVAFTTRYTSGFIIAISGALLMSFPFILNSEWFDWVFGIAVGICLLDGIYILYRKTTEYFLDKNNQ